MVSQRNEAKIVGAALVVGGGIAGMQAALDLAESDIQVYLLEKSPWIGGRMAQLDKTFPTNDCAMCIMAPRLVECSRHHNIEIISNADLVKLTGQAGDFTATIRRRARHVDEEKCTGCEECTLNCPVQYIPYSSPVEVAEPEITPEDREKVDQFLDQYKYKRAPLIPVLQGINAWYNYLPPETLYYVSRRLGIPLAHILRVATFYALFSLKPRGKHVISVCHGTACFVRGAERLTDRLQEELGIGIGEVTEDGEFSLETVRCIGCCALAPVMKVGEEVHGKLHPKEVTTVLKGH
ncbi:MAG: NAD(P)H-dependent oxidoreductase subunit E [Chloroflexota bacterium]